MFFGFSLFSISLIRVFGGVFFLAWLVNRTPQLTAPPIVQKYILKYLAGWITALLGLLSTAFLANFWEPICNAMATKSCTRLLLPAFLLSALCAVYCSLKWAMAVSKNPRRFARWVEKGGFWQSTTGKTKFCGKCMMTGERRELKYNPPVPGTWECLSCGTAFSPHEPEK
jgi:hypothetical protein